MSTTTKQLYIWKSHFNLFPFFIKFLCCILRVYAFSGLALRMHYYNYALSDVVGSFWCSSRLSATSICDRNARMCAITYFKMQCDFQIHGFETMHANVARLINNWKLHDDVTHILFELLFWEFFLNFISQLKSENYTTLLKPCISTVNRRFVVDYIFLFPPVSPSQSQYINLLL